MTDRRRFLAGASVLMTHAAFPSVIAAFATGAAAQSTSLFSVTQMRTLTALVDVILPATDSPAASAANTHLFVNSAAQACATETAQRTLIAGLDAIEAESQRRHRRAYADLRADRQATILAARAEADMPLAYDQSFFKILKDYTMVGYFHSEIGAMQALAYEQIPGGYWGDLPLEPGQKAWAI